MSGAPEAHTGSVGSVSEPPGGTPGEILAVEHITKFFHRGTGREVKVLDDVSFRLTQGEVLVVIGPSGSGKSTLLRCLNFVAPPDSGAIHFMEREWVGQPHDRLSLLGQYRLDRRLMDLRTHIGMVFQQFNLFPHLTALGNVTIGLTQAKKMTRRDAEHVAIHELERVGLGGKAQSYPSHLSGGEKQRVAIARALAMQPKIMLFDEITSALDPELVGGILEEIQKLALAGMTMIVVTHEMRFAREVGDRIIFMDNGRIVETGPARRVIDDPQNSRTKAFLRAIL